MPATLSATVLIIEDDPGIAALELDRLEEAGYQCVTAADPGEAFEALRSQGIDLILLDYRLPGGMNGLQFYDRMRAAGYDQPVILVTGFGNEATVIQALRVGVRDFVTKSLEYLDYLPDAVGRVLGQVRTEHQLAGIIESARDAIISTDLDRRVTVFNPAAERMFRCPAGAALGRPVTEFVPDESLAAGAPGDTPPLAARPGAWGVRAGGKRFPVEVSVSRGDDRGRRFYTLIVRDVTDRVRMEDELRRTAGLLSAVVEGTTDAVFVKDREGRYLLANPATAAFLRRPAEDIIGRTDAELMPPDEARQVRAHDLQAMAADRAVSIEEQLVLGGTRHAFLSTKAAYRTASGAVVGVIGISRDVTERNRLATERDALLARLQLQIGRMPLAYVLFDTDLRIVDWNPAAERMFGYTREEALGRDGLELAAPSFRPTAERLLGRIRGGDMTVHPVGENVRKDGRVIVCEWYNTPLMDPDGRYTGLLSLGQDVTARVAAEEALRQRDRAIHAVTQGIVITDARRPGHPIVFVSPGFERLTGYSAAEALGRNCRFLQGKDTDPAAVDRLRDALRDERACTVELLNYRKDGTAFWNELSLSPVRDGGDRVTQFVGVLTDVTQRRALEEQFRQAQKMEAIGQLAGGIAHDFNNLLTVINGFSELTLRQLPTDDPCQPLVTEIRDAGERATRLTRKLLTFSRKEVVEPVVLDLNATVDGARGMLRWLLGEGVRLVVKSDPRLDRVRADAGHVEQVILNLAVNARDAMPHGGTLTVGTANVTSDGPSGPGRVPAGRYVRLSVADTGVGMTEEIQAKIFEPFFTTKAIGQGTGLGLSTVYGIVQQTGGHIRVTSAPGRGATFEVYFPSAGRDPADAQAAHAAEPGGPTGRGTVLVVEDDDRVRRLARIALQRFGYTVLDAPSAEEALRVCERPEPPIDLLLTDVVMPGMGGRELAEVVARLRPGIKVLYVSGYADDAVVRHGVLRAEVAFLQKPFTPAALAEKVRSVLE
ncbi:Blue-light-activated protein [Gemmata obscuriglobus]|uniref:histidine kinase n=1 Tax=Gemmata obscuriglobus TaxID=114 RepID=A0A2Z3H535_9BACT|nr:PAS domain S-box protein [Gemmata obscuriglobus]AWM39442.1 hybrid sensor histidine kinase/response regulator [Gemmata obscuriglobus]QEG27476.1 Blue-light-activated protein [Gemmata obscuriglobus]VTS04471.1 multi-sensor hybrid histidine kinase : PAS/PAC sensor hybrid histidine kinase OS=Caldithrix abyssi DSM 13497 GN=Calab_1764 PE=4 SV=1: Response_reg: PAS_9: PAS_4: PAS_4: PAS_9: HisKA: HATPase_c: Response_reg [Gemmata obscuriglobus UQM 2246]